MAEPHKCIDLDDLDALSDLADRLRFRDGPVPGCCLALAIDGYLRERQDGESASVSLSALFEQANVMRARLCALGDHVWSAQTPSGLDDLKALMLSGERIPHACNYCHTPKP